MPFRSVPLLIACLLLPTAKDPPRLQVDPAGWVDLGSLGPLERRTVTYRFHNTSDAPLSLRILDQGAGFSAGGPALAGPIAGGGEAALTLTFDAAGGQGPRQVQVRLATDDPAQGTYLLPVRAVVRPDLTVDGQRRDFGDVAAYESPRVAFRFARETGAPPALRIAGALPPYLEPELLPGPAGTELGFVLRPARIPPGARQGLEPVRVETGAAGPAFELYLSWRIHYAVEAEPARVVFQDPAAAEQELVLAARDGRPFRIARAALAGRGFRVGPLPAPAPRQTLRIRRTARGPARAMLVLAISGREPDLRVPLAYLPAVRSAAPPPRRRPVSS